MPMWLKIIVICCCLCFSALFSGLNLGLMSLDRTELKVNEISSKIPKHLHINSFILLSFVCRLFYVDSSKHRQRKWAKICGKNSASARPWQFSSMQHFIGQCFGEFNIYYSIGWINIRTSCDYMFNAVDCNYWWNNATGWWLIGVQLCVWKNNRIYIWSHLLLLHAGFFCLISKTEPFDEI